MSTDSDASAGLKRPAPGRGEGCRRYPPARPALAMAACPAIAATAAPVRLPDSGPLRDDLPLLDTRAPDYRTRPAGEVLRTKILGEEVSVPVRDARHIQAWKLGAQFASPSAAVVWCLRSAHASTPAFSAIRW